LKAAAEGSYIRLPGSEAAQGGVRVSFAFSPRLEDRRLKPLTLIPAALTRHSGVTLWDGPRILLVNTEQARPTLIVPVGKEGRLQIPRDENGKLTAVLAPQVNATEQEIAAASKNGEHLLLLPWEGIRKDAAAAFVFDLIGVPQSGQSTEAAKPKH
jgi:hypothetical protein